VTLPRSGDRLSPDGVQDAQSPVRSMPLAQVVSCCKRTFRAEAPAWCLERADEAAKRQPVPLEMEDEVVAPQAAYELMTAFKDPHHGSVSDRVPHSENKQSARLDPSHG